jgi:hypothetical protein
MRALLAGLGLAVVAAPLGCFVVWRRMAYYGEAVAQAGLIGIAAGLALSLNLTASVLIVTLAVSILLVALGRQQLVPFDSLLGLLAHAALAIGVILASLVRGPQLDLMAFLFGDIFAISSADLKWIYVGGALALAALFYVWRPLLSISVHEDLAAAEGTPVERVKFIFVLVLALAGSAATIHAIDGQRKPERFKEVLYIRSPKALRIMSLGYTGLLADFYWTRAVQYFGYQHFHYSTDLHLLGPLLEIATQLDPKLLPAYEFGSNFLAPQPPNGAAEPERRRFQDRDRSDRAVRLHHAGPPRELPDVRVA